MTEQPPSVVTTDSNLPALEPAASPREDLLGRALVRTVAGAIITGGVLIYILDFTKEILAPLTLAVFVNLVLGRAVRRLAHLKIPRPLGALLVLGSVTAVLFAIALWSAPSAQRWASEVPSALSELRAAILEREAFSTLLSATQKADETASLIGDSVAIPVEVAERGAPAWVVEGTGVLVDFVFVFVLAYLMLSAGDRFRVRTRAIFKGSPLRERLLAATEDIEQSVSTYVVTISLINVGLAVGVGCAMWLVGLEDPMLWGATAGLLNFIPYVGPLLTAGLIGIAAFTTFGTLTGGIVAVSVYLCVNALEAFVVTPIVLGHRLQLSPVATLVSVLFWTWIWGFAGALVAIPFLVVAYCICLQISPLRSMAILIAR